jgi:hypothetical protein
MKTINKKNSQALTLFASLLFLTAVTFILVAINAIVINLF